MKDLTTDLAQLTLKDRLIQAVRDFEQKQQSNTLAWLEAQIKECESSDDQQQSRDKLAKTLRFDSWTSLAAKHNISSPLQLPSIDIGQNERPTRAPVSDNERQSFLESLHAAINDVYDQESPKYKPLSLPEDYGLLLSIAEGIRDTDLRGSGVSGIDGIQEASIDKMTSDEVENLPWGNELWRSGWELSTGFILGKKAHDQWLVYYYCSRREITSRGPRRQKKDEILEHQKPWKWRLFYKEPERFRHSFFNPMVFEGVVEWLVFYREWWHREVEVYPAWRENNRRDVELLHGQDPELEGELGPD